MKPIELSFDISNIYLGLKEGEKLEADVHQYLVVDDFDVSTGKNGLIISIREHHIKEYKVKYCVDCLKEGIKNRDAPYGLHSKTENWNRCNDHYAEYMRSKDPENACPECEKGYLRVYGIEGEGRCCTYCEHRISLRPFFSFSPASLVCPSPSELKGFEQKGTRY